MDVQKVINKVKEKPTPIVVEKVLSKWVHMDGMQYSKKSIEIFTEAAKIGYYLGIQAAKRKLKSGRKEK